MKLLLTIIAVTLPVLGLLHYIYSHDKIKPEPTIIYLRANAFESIGNYKANMIAGSGTKADILTILQSEDFINEIGYTFGKHRDNLKDL